MNELDAEAVLSMMTAAKRADVRRWMDSYGIEEATLTRPMLSLLSAVVDTDDEGARRVVAALLEQELPGRQAREA